MKKHSHHLPDPFKVSNVSKIFDEWSSDNKYQFPHIKTEGFEKHFSPSDEINELKQILQNKDTQFFNKAYKSYLRYITAHEKGKLVQNQETLKALSYLRQMILSRASSQRFMQLFERLESVQTNATHRKKKKDKNSKHKLPRLPDPDKLQLPNQNQKDKNETGNEVSLQEEPQIKEELPPFINENQKSGEEKKKKHGYHKHHKKEKSSDAKSTNSANMEQNKEYNKVVIVEENENQNPPIKVKRILDSDDEDALISPYTGSSSLNDDENDQSKQKSNSSCTQPSSKSVESYSANQQSESQSYKSTKSDSKPKENFTASKSNKNNSSDIIDYSDNEYIDSDSKADKKKETPQNVLFTEDETVCDGNPLQQFITLLKRQTNGLINEDVLRDIYQKLSIYKPILEDSNKANIPILQEYQNQIEAGFFPIESIQNLVFMLKSISEKV